MSEPHPSLVERLSAAGYRYLETLPMNSDLVPVLVARYLTQLLPDEGRRDVVISHDKPDLTSVLNKTWGRLARESGLLSTSRRGASELLVGLDLAVDVPDEPEFERHRWVRVSAHEYCDIAGVGCENGVLGVGRNNPSFVMASLDGRVLLAAGYWQIGVGFAVITDPGRVLSFRDHAKRLTSFPFVEAAQRDWAERWVRTVSSEDESIQRRDSPRSDAG
ncbi:hypothetical protein [Streptomyces alkaliterrae]|uniref:Uncharacterized protein n=1 Tax=Streptomyces alkaliterrae TaxID=2213162 RepID=A0A5P0YJN4_9ACTN|nr:hypothetical protein [Streptomyces alkaliterrae]MBB1262185.1 hypothetical protein [Streptomyces alkaliterrae]MQS00525.1 hypothetical protein [Streptomyces alkaliterrae]